MIFVKDAEYETHIDKLYELVSKAEKKHDSDAIASLRWALVIIQDHKEINEGR